MKISNKQKEKNRKKIIQIAVDVMIEQGFKSATMRAIAKKAEIGDATIYNYFPTKESILFAYYEEKLKECAERLRSVDKFNEFTLNEQLQTFIHTQLELFLPDREFIDLSFKRIFFSLSQNYQQMKPIRQIFAMIVDDMFKAAIEVNEIPDQIFQDMIYLLLWDSFVGIVIFWLNDRSEQFNDTTVLVDKSLDLLCPILRSGLIDKAADILLYFFKSHLLSRLDGFRKSANTFSAIKREFMGNLNDR